MEEHIVMFHKVTCEKAAAWLPDIREDILLSWEEQMTLIEVVKMLDYHRTGHVTWEEENSSFSSIESILLSLRVSQEQKTYLHYIWAGVWCILTEKVEAEESSHV